MINQWIGVGEVVRDPVMRTTDRNKGFCPFTAKTTEMRDDLEYDAYHDIVAWNTGNNNFATWVETTLRKGMRVLVMGSVRYRKNKDCGCYRASINPKEVVLVPDTTPITTNQILLVGDVVRNVQLRFTGKGQPFVPFTMKTSEKWANGTIFDAFHSVTVWGDTAQWAEENLIPGSMVSVLGNMRYRKNEECGCYRADINVDKITLLSTGVATADATPAADAPDEDSIPF